MTKAEFYIGKEIEGEHHWLCRKPNGDYGYYWSTNMAEAIGYLNKQLPVVAGTSLAKSKWYNATTLDAVANVLPF